MRRSEKVARSFAVVSLLGSVLGGCAQGTTGFLASGPDEKAEAPVTQAPMPSVVRHLPRIEATLACINRTGVLKARTFVVGPFADSTGKINASAMGATGNFIPQGGSAAFLTDALSKAGGRVVSTYFGQPAVNSPAQYAINGIFNSLDFGTPMQADVRVAGMGPTAQVGFASLSLSIQLDEAGTRINRQMSMIQRPVRYSALGAGVGTIAGTTLVTGNVTFQNQERLQFEAINGPIALGVADVIMKEFPAARHACYSIVADLLTSEVALNSDEGDVAIPAPVRPDPAPQPSSIARAPDVLPRPTAPVALAATTVRKQEPRVTQKAVVRPPVRAETRPAEPKPVKPLAQRQPSSKDGVVAKERRATPERVSSAGPFYQQFAEGPPVLDASGFVAASGWGTPFASRMGEVSRSSGE